MFESQVLFYLKKYLGTYLEGVDESSLKVSVWAGNIFLSNLKLRVEAFDELRFPVSVEAGLLGSLNLKVPWARLGTEPVVLEIDKLFVLLKSEHATKHHFSQTECEDIALNMMEAFLELKRQRVHGAEIKWMQGLVKNKTGSENTSPGFLEDYMTTILNNLQIRITNLHIRYEDDTSNQGRKFALGMMLSELSACTVDRTGNKAFVSAKDLKKILKSAELRQFSVYFDPEAEFFCPSTKWNLIDTKEWSDFFLRPIKDEHQMKHRYFLHPVNGVCRYHQNRHIHGHQWAESEPTRFIDITLKEVNTTLSRKQFELLQSLLTVVDMYQRRSSCCSLRPGCRPRGIEAIRLWWLYAYLSVKQRYRISRKWKLSEIGEVANIRRKYIEIYSTCLKNGIVGGDNSSKTMECHLNEQTIFTFRKLAHLQVEDDKRSAIAVETKTEPATWSSWFWGTTATTETAKESTEAPFTAEDWRRLMESAEFQKEEAVKETPYTLQLEFAFHLESCSLCLQDHNDQSFLHGSLMHTNACYKQYPKTMSYGFEITQATLSSEGLPIMTTLQDVDAEMNRALQLEYVILPQDRNVVASVKIETSSTYMTFHAPAVKTLMEFLAPNKSVDVSVLEAKAFSKFKEARSLAERQVMDFSEPYDIQIKLNAPKLAVPCTPVSQSTGMSSILYLLLKYLFPLDNIPSTTFILDLGTLSLNTTDQTPQFQKNFKMTVSNVTSYLLHGEFTWSMLPEVSRGEINLLPLLDIEGFQADLTLPSMSTSKTTLNAICSLPEIRFHLSPSRYEAIASVLTSMSDAFYPKQINVSTEDYVDAFLQGPISVLVWEGLGNRTPKWKRYTGTLRTLYLYVETPEREIIRWIRLDQDLDVVLVPEKWTLGKKHVVALMTTGVPLKRAMEDPSVFMFALDSAMDAIKWKNQIQITQHSGLLETSSLELDSLGVDQAEELGFQFCLKGSIEQVLTYVHGRPVNATIMNMLSDPEDQSVDFEESIEEVPLILSKKEQSTVSFILDTDLGIKLDFGVVNYSIEDLFLYKITGKRSFLSVSSCQDSAAEEGHQEYVKIGFSSLNKDSSEYKNVDNEVTLDFNDVEISCHRVTYAALIALVYDLTSIGATESDEQDSTLSRCESEEFEEDSLVMKMPSGSNVSTMMDWKNPDRVLFRLKMTASNTYLALEYEDLNRKLATAKFQDFEFNVDIGAQDFEITSTLGNVLIYDETLPRYHSLRQICGLKSETSSSLISATFQSHDARASYLWDQVPSGNPFYSLKLNFSQVQIVHFQRFVDEFLDYIYVMMEMIPSLTESQIENNPIDLATSALKAAGVSDSTIVVLDIQLQDPLGLLPRSSKDRDLITADLGNVKITNVFECCNGPYSMIQTIQIQLTDTLLSVKHNEIEGENLLRNCNEVVQIDIQMIVKDETKTLPRLVTDVKIPKLHGTLTDNELAVIMACFNDNFFEDVNIPPLALQLTKQVFPEATTCVAESEKPDPETLSYSCSAMITNIRVQDARMILYTTSKCGSNRLVLCCVHLTDFFCCYSSLQTGSSIGIDAPKLEIVDMRPNAVIKNQVVFSSGNKPNEQEVKNGPTPAFLRAHYHWLDNEQEFKIDLQKPLACLEPDFLLSLLNFFFPEWNTGTTNLKGFCTHDIHLTDTVFVAQRDLFLSPEVRLLADRPGVDTFVYDGAGHKLILPHNMDPLDAIPLILVGVGKTLHFKNLTIVPAASLSSIIQLKAGSRILADEEDNVQFKNSWKPDSLPRLSSGRCFSKRASTSVNCREAKAPPVLIFKFRAFGATLEFVDVSHLKENQSDESTSSSVHKLVITFDAEGIFHSTGEDMNADGIIHSLVMDTSRSTNSEECCALHRRVLEPCDLKGKCSSSEAAQRVEFNLDQLALNVTPDLVEMIKKIQKQLLEPLTLPQSGQPTTPCTGYDLIWSNTTQQSKTQYNQSSTLSNFGISFWRPQCPAGYATLGDVATIGELPFSEQALCVSLSSGFVAFPTGFTPVLRLENKATIWKPVPPRGYVALGCLARKHARSGERLPPSETACVCVHEEVVVETVTGSCLWTDSKNSIWSLLNAAHSFTISSTTDSMPNKTEVLNLRFPLGKNVASTLASTSSNASFVIEKISRRAFERFSETRDARLVDVTLQRLTISTVEFLRLLVDKDCKTEMKTGFWRPIPPTGYCWLGDCLQPQDSRPPRSALVFCLDNQELENPCFAPAQGFNALLQESTSRTRTLTLLEPIPRPGYVALGNIIYLENSPAPLESFRCVRKDLVELVEYETCRPSAEIVYGKKSLYFWKTDNKTHTFRVTTSATNLDTSGFYRLKKLDIICARETSIEETKKTELSCILHCGPTSIQIRDLTQIPIMEINLDQFVMTMEQKGDFAKAFSALDCSIYSYNVLQRCWEPVLTPTNILLNYRQNLNDFEKDGIEPGRQMKITAAEQSVSLMLSSTALKRVTDALSEWTETCDQETDEALTHDSGTTRVFNALESSVEMLCDYGWNQRIFEIESGHHEPIPLPLYSPLRHQIHSKGIAERRDMLGVVITSVKGPSLSGKELFVDIRFNVFGAGKEPSLFTSRKLQADEDGTVIWNQLCITHFKFGISQQCYITVNLHDSSHGIQSQLLGSIDMPLPHDELQIEADATQSPFITRNLSIPETGEIQIQLFKEVSFAEAYSAYLGSEDFNNKGDRALSLGFSSDWISIPIGGIQQLQHRSVPLLNCSKPPTSIIPMKLGNGVVIERCFEDKGRYETIRNPCVFVNSTSFDLQVRLVQEGEYGSVHNFHVMTPVQEIVEHEIFESERYLPVVGWKSRMAIDRKRYSLDSKGIRQYSHFPNIDLPKGWEWKGPWQLDKTNNVDQEGWAYASDFAQITWPPRAGSEKHNVFTNTRQRRWVRKSGRIAALRHRNSSEMCNVLGVCPAGKALPLTGTGPLGKTILQLRPILGQLSHHQWSEVASPESSRLYLSNLENGSTFLTVCHLEGTGSGLIDLGEMAWNCLSSFWLSLVIESTILPIQDHNDHLMDWTITAQPVLTIQNLFKVPSQFEIQEKSETGFGYEGITREQGICQANSTLPIHTVDTRKEITLVFSPEGYRFNNQKPVTLSFGFSQYSAGVSGPPQLPGSFQVDSENGDSAWIMIHRVLDSGVLQQKHKDPGAAVSLGFRMDCQLYVPLWIINHTSVPVEAALVTFSQSKTELKLPFSSEETQEDSDFKSVHTSPVRDHTGYPASSRTIVQGQKAGFLSYTASEELQYGVKLRLEGSGSAPPIALSPQKVSKAAGRRLLKPVESGFLNVKKLVINAAVPHPVNKLYQVIASLEETGTGFIRSNTLIIDPCLTASNQTGMNLFLYQPFMKAPQQQRTSRESHVELTALNRSASQSTDVLSLPPGQKYKELHDSLSHPYGIFQVAARLPGASSSSQWSPQFKINPEITGDFYLVLNKQQDLISFIDEPGETAVKYYLHYRVQKISRGCSHLTFVSIGCPPPIVIENRTRSLLVYKQTSVLPDPKGEVLAPLSATGWSLPVLIYEQPIISIWDPLLTPITQTNGVLVSRLDIDQPLDEVTIQQGVKQDRYVPMKITEGGGVIEIIDLCDSESHYSAYQSLEAAYQHQWGSERVVRIHPHHKFSSIRRFTKSASNGSESKVVNLVLEVESAEISVIDHIPRELILFSIDRFTLEVISGLGPKSHHCQLRIGIDSAQVDDQLLGSAYPVLAKPWNRSKDKSGKSKIFSFAIARDDDLHHGRRRYPFIVSQLGNIDLSVHEPIAWRLADMIRSLGYHSEHSTHSGANLDVELEVSLLHVGGLCFNVTTRTEPSCRPRSLTSQSLMLGLELATIEDVEIPLSGHERHEIREPASMICKKLDSHVRDQIWRAFIHLVEFYLSLGGVSQALSAIGKAIKTTSESSGTPVDSSTKVDSLHAGIFGGGSTIAKGVFSGVTGVMKKPYEGVKKDGVRGLVKGVGKGIIGIAANPIGGVFEAASQVAQGIDVFKDDITSIITKKTEDVTDKRRRLPLCIKGDRLVSTFNIDSAIGQWIMHEIHGQFRKLQKELEEEFYEGHCFLTTNSMILWTTERITVITAASLYEWYEDTKNSHWQKRKEIPELKKQCSCPWSQLLAFNLQSRSLQGFSSSESHLITLHLRSSPSTRSEPPIKTFSYTPRTDRDLQKEIWKALEKYGVHIAEEGGVLPLTHISRRDLLSNTMSVSLLCPGFRLIWQCFNGSFWISFWKPNLFQGYASIGDVVVIGKQDMMPDPVHVFLDDSCLSKQDSLSRLANPVAFNLVFRDNDGMYGPVTIWEPIPPHGYVVIGCIVIAGLTMPSLDSVFCLRSDLTAPYSHPPCLVWQKRSSQVNVMQCLIWLKERTATGLFVTSSSQDSPPPPQLMGVPDRSRLLNAEKK
eukprot:g5933.t1